MIRRQFVAALGLAAWPLATQAQQQAMPVVGLVDPRSSDDFGYLVRAFRQGLKEAGFVEGENVMVEYRLADNQPEQIPILMADLVRRPVAVIATTGGFPVALAAKEATKTIPIVFGIADDPVSRGLVTSLARPGGNMTGINFISAELAAKRFELLRELVPAAARVAVLLNPASSSYDITLRDMQAVVRAVGLQIQVFRASTSREIDAAFESLVRERPDALFVGTDPFFTARRVQLVHLATLNKIPASYPGRQFPEVGGLMSYGASLTDTFRRIALYVGRILRGAKPADMPILQSDKFDLVINHQTARTLGLTVPPTLLARADEVME